MNSTRKRSKRGSAGRGRLWPQAWIQTFTGRQFWPLEPDPADVVIEDIAHHLARKCRFNGATRRFYSVAQHSVLVAESLVGRGVGVQLLGLLHDAAEAYLPDVARPYKSQCWVGDLRFDAAENEIRAAVLHGLGLFNCEIDRQLRVQRWIAGADDRALATEKRDLMAKAPAGWGLRAKPWPKRIEPAAAAIAEQDFLRVWRDLTWRLGKDGA